MLLAAVGLILAPVVVLHWYLNSDRLTRQLRARVARELQQRGIEARLGGVEVDWWGRVTLTDFVLPSPDGTPPLLRAKIIRIRPSYRALLRGQIQAASLRFVEPALLPGRHAEVLRAFLTRWKSRPAAHPAGPMLGHEDLPLLRVQRGVLTLGTEGAEGHALTFGPLDGELSLKRDEEHREVEAELSLKPGGLIKTSARWGLNESLLVSMKGTGFTAESLPELLRARGSVRLDAGTFSFGIQLESAPNLRTGSVTYSIRGQDVIVSGERLAQEPVGPWMFGTSGTLRWDRLRRKLKLDNGELDVGPHDELKLGLTGEGSYVSPFGFRLDAHVDRVPYQDALDALPPQLNPGADAPRLDGPFSAQLTLQGAARDPDGWTVAVNLDLSRLKETARAAPFKLKGPFSYQPRDGVGTPREILVGDKNPSFIPISQLPTFVYRAVTTSEDGGFFAHHGFDFQEMKNSFVSVAADKRVRGASTITQQLAKNLFLSRERTYARKVQEALLTIAMESALTKQRLLEIYLNIIEWGPNIYGLGEAARHYFGKDARALTPKEAAFLATLIPNPIRYHSYFTRGSLTEAWETRVHDLLVKMHDQNVLTDMEYMDAVEAPIAFRKPEAGAQRRPRRVAPAFTPLPLPPET